MEISHGIISTAILSLPLIQVGQLSAVHLVLVKCLGSLHRNSVVWLTVRPDMAIVVDWDVKPHIKQLDKKLYTADIYISHHHAHMRAGKYTATLH